MMARANHYESFREVPTIPLNAFFAAGTPHSALKEDGVLTVDQEALETLGFPKRSCQHPKRHGIADRSETANVPGGPEADRQCQGRNGRKGLPHRSRIGHFAVTAPLEAEHDAWRRQAPDAGTGGGSFA